MDGQAGRYLTLLKVIIKMLKTNGESVSPALLPRD